MVGHRKISVMTRVLCCLLAVAFCYIQPLAPEARAQTAALPQVIPVGRTIGVWMQIDGVIVMGLSFVKTESGEIRPAEAAGLVVGDRITHVNNTPILTVTALQNSVDNSGGEPISVRVARGGDVLNLSVRPVRAVEGGGHKIGAWVRDSMSGIGTMTFFIPESGFFGALGHGVNDPNAGGLLPFSKGAVLNASVREIVRGQVGNPGELKGEFASEKKIGRIISNTDNGIFGFLEDTDIVRDLSVVPMAAASEVKTGPATVISNVRDGKVEIFDIEIVKIYSGNTARGRNFMLRVTDPRLLDLTGGIVQGMSGSPIIQNGKLAGAVTHVLVGDPKRGYGIFAETMLAEGQAGQCKIAS